MLGQRTRVFGSRTKAAPPDGELAGDRPVDEGGDG
jgi:hypothetical protein